MKIQHTLFYLSLEPSKKKLFLITKKVYHLIKIIFEYGLICLHIFMLVTIFHISFIESMREKEVQPLCQTIEIIIGQRLERVVSKYAIQLVFF